jgi:small subunit ribosomal protein S13
MPEDEPEEPKSAEPKEGRDEKQRKKGRDAGEKGKEGGEKGEKGEKGKEGKKEQPKKEILKDEGEDFKYIVRVVSTDLDGHKSVHMGVTAIPGVGARLGEAVARQLGPVGKKRLGDLTDDEVAQLTEAVDALAETVPPWMLNRQHDVESGHDTHLIGVDIQVQRTDDVNRMKKIRCYKGVRHESGHKVRGQRTSSNGRRGMTLGVIRKKE